MSFLSVFNFFQNFIFELAQPYSSCFETILSDLNIETELFSKLPDCQKLLLDEMSDQVIALLDDNIQMEVTSNLLQTLLEQVGSSPPSQRVVLQKVLMPLIGRLSALVRAPDDDENRVVIPSLNASLLNILCMFTPSTYEWYLKNHILSSSKSSNHAISVFLSELFSMLQLIIKSDVVYPAHWIGFKLLASRTILATIKLTSTTLFAHFLSKNDFSIDLWSAFFTVSIAFLDQDFLQLERIVPIKRLKIQFEYGDMRQEMAFLVRDMWLNLGRNKSYFVSNEDIALDMVGAVLRMTLVPVHAIRMETLPIFFDMINFEVGTSRKGLFTRFENALVTSMDEYFSNGLGDTNYIELFVQVLSSWCLRHEQLQVTGLDFVRKMNILMKLLLEFQEVTKKNKDEEDEMLCIEKLLKFFRLELNRLDLYTAYLYKLYTIHIRTNNYTEAAYALWEHANRLAWADSSLDKGHRTLFVRKKYENCKTERDLKEELYEEIIDLLDLGKMWEEAIKCCKELEKEFEEQLIDFDRLGVYLERRASLSRKIINNSSHLRTPPVYFFVGYFGHGWPEQYSNRMFIYRGAEFERLDAIADRIQTRFPKSQRLSYTKPPDNDVKHSISCYLQIYPLHPVGQIPTLFQDKPVPRQILEYYQNNQISRFTYDRPYHVGQRDKTNEVATLWVERRTYRTAGIFPGILRWFEVEDTSIYNLSPLQNAMSTVEKQNKDLTSMITEFSQTDSGNFQQLTQKLAGTVDPAVSGGFTNYERAFLCVEFQSIATHEELQQVDKLKDLMAQQIPILEQLLIIHDELIHQNEIYDNLVPLHEQLTRKFHQLKAEVEEKYGRRPRQTQLHRHASSIARRQSKRSSRPNLKNRESSSSDAMSRPSSGYIGDVPDVPLKVTTITTLGRRYKGETLVLGDFFIFLRCQL